MADYSIWVLEYAAVEQFPVSFMLYGAQGLGHRKLPYAYVLLKKGADIVMIDMGYNHVAYGSELANLYGVSNWHPPDVVLAECGVSPLDVTSILITHAHFDHMGSMALFPRAKFYIQKRELSKWVWSLTLGPEFRFLVGATDPADIMTAVEYAKTGRMVCVDGDQENLLPAIDVHLAEDTHTYGSMYVRVRNDGVPNSRDAWIFAGDNIYTYDNLTGLDPANPQFIPIGYAVGSQANLIFSTAEMLKAVDGEQRRLIPIHEDRLKSVFPSRLTSKGLQLIEVALADGEPSRVA
jgi:N-acyl homoserine lactone hydrolase